MTPEFVRARETHNETGLSLDATTLAGSTGEVFRVEAETRRQYIIRYGGSQVLVHKGWFDPVSDPEPLFSATLDGVFLDALSGIFGTDAMMLRWLERSSDFNMVEFKKGGKTYRLSLDVEED